MIQKFESKPFEYFTMDDMLRRLLQDLRMQYLQMKIEEQMNDSMLEAPSIDEDIKAQLLSRRSEINFNQRTVKSRIKFASQIDTNLISRELGDIQ